MEFRVNIIKVSLDPYFALVMRESNLLIRSLVDSTIQRKLGVILEVVKVQRILILSNLVLDTL
jgi:hypothetical protein